jgi:3D-(3,5/4)-trihydroxycyclohexane-1,2-dione acylhydrolase (decyclizing)
MNRITDDMRIRAQAIAAVGSLGAALAANTLPRTVDLSCSEALVLGLLQQGIRTYIGVFGHGSTAIGEVLRVYEAAGLVRVFNVRSEIEASHAATALKWQYGETAAVFTSIGPGALQALAASVAPASNGIGLYYLLGDETTQDEGYNMQQIPLQEQFSFLKLASAMGAAYTVADAWSLPAALKRGAATVFASDQPAPFYLLLPMNTQAAWLETFNLGELPGKPVQQRFAPADEECYLEAIRQIESARRITVKVGNGARGVDQGILDEFLRRCDAVFVHGPSSVGVLSGLHPRNMRVGGSKGSMSGNAAMEEADLVILIGARAVCQWDCSGTAWKSAQSILSINARVEDALHYNRSLPLVGDADAILRHLVESLRSAGVDRGQVPTSWFLESTARRQAWDAFVSDRVSIPALFDPKFGKELLTQPAAIHTVVEFAREIGAVKYFDAGDVQANGFQIVEDETVGNTFTEIGASYMGFASCGILASAMAEKPAYPIAFTGDGSFTMNPQVLIDAAQYRLRGTIVVFDNRRMAAISSLQVAQYGADFRTDDSVAVDYPGIASSIEGVLGLSGGSTKESLRDALRRAYQHQGPALIHVQVYSGSDERGGLGAYGAWNVGAWCEAVQKEKHRLGF